MLPYLKVILISCHNHLISVNLPKVFVAKSKEIEKSLLRIIKWNKNVEPSQITPSTKHKLEMPFAILLKSSFFKIVNH